MPAVGDPLAHPVLPSNLLLVLEERMHARFLPSQWGLLHSVLVLDAGNSLVLGTATGVCLQQQAFRDSCCLEAQVSKS